MTTPDRSLQQRLDALRHANEVRSYRAQLKRDVAGCRVDADDVLVSGDPLVATMRALDLVGAVPGLGKVKTDVLFRKSGISPSKTIGGLSARQRARLLVFLRQYRTGSPTYARRKRTDAA